MRFVLLAGLAALLADPPPRAAADSLPGDTADDPLPIPSLPFHATGNTCDYLDDYDEFCPIDGQLSQDVVYAYEPPADVVVNVSLCESGYDTKILIYENVAYTGNLHACDDDACSGPNWGWPYLAYAREVPLYTGNVYFFVVDGYGSSCGPYDLQIVENVSCTLVCPPGGQDEPEIKCIDGVHDSTSAGCSADVPAFHALEPSTEPVTICGFTNYESFHNRRDEDWYELAPAGPDTIVVTCEPDFAAYVTVYDGAGGCDDPVVLAYALTEPCETPVLPVVLPPESPGPVWIRVRPLTFHELPCPAKYVLTVEGHDGPVAAIPPPVAGADDFDLLTVAPTPFVAAVTIRGTAPRGTRVTLRIHDVTGRVVRTLLDGAFPGDRRDFVWDGRNGAGGDVAAGVYFARWSDGKRERTAKLVRARP